MKKLNVVSVIAWLTIAWTVITAVGTFFGVFSLPWWAVIGPVVFMICLTVAIIINVGKL